VSSQEVTRVNGAVTRSDKLDNKAWQLQLAWLLTGEEETFRSPTPSTNYQPGKPGYGAWELVARVHQLTIDPDAFIGGADSYANPTTAAQKATAAALGINWYLNQNLKWFFGYEQTRFDGGGATGDRPDEKAYLARVGLQF
jgi:phosphate-selective porin OprO/OprP